MRRRRATKHENSLMGDRKGRPYTPCLLFVGADLASALLSAVRFLRNRGSAGKSRRLEAGKICRNKDIGAYCADIDKKLPIFSECYFLFEPLIKK